MTVTLQDMSCLWGLPIHGKPIISQADGPWVDLIEGLLGIPANEQKMKQKRRKKEDETTVVRHSQYSLSLRELRDRFPKMPKKPTQEQVDRHT